MLRGAPSRRLQSAAIAVVVFAALLLGLLSLAKPKPRITGNNAVWPSAFVTDLTPASGSLCTSGVSVPSGTSGVRLFIGTYQRDDLRMTMRTQSATGRTLGISRPAAFGNGAHVTFALPKDATDKLTLCWRSSGRVAVAGGPNGALSPEQASMIDDRPVPGDLSIEYMRPGKHSALAMMPTVFERAAMFRPGWVGAWTYYAVFVVYAATIALAIWMLLLAGRRDLRRSWRAWAAIAAIAFVNAGLWALVTPAFNAPDEYSHFTYVETLARGELPDRTLAKGDPGNSYLPSSVFASQVTAVNVIQRSFVKEPWDASTEQQFKGRFAELRAGPDAPYGLTPAAGYTPLYYAPATLAYKLAPSDAIFDQLLLIRLYSALLLALGVIFTMLFVREMLPGVRWGPPVAGLAVAFEPMAAHLGGAVSNDNLMLAACAATLWLGARVLRRGVDFRGALSLMGMMVISYAAKPTAIGLAPAVGFVLLMAVLRADDRRRAMSITALAAIVPILMLLALRLTLGSSGSLGSTGAASELRPATLTGYLSYLWQWYLPTIGSMDNYFVGTPPAFRVFFGGFLADFNSLDTNFADWLYVVTAAAAFVLLVLALRAVWLRRSRLSTEWTIAAYPAIAVAGTALLVNTVGYLLWHQDGQLFAQGRYLFPVLAVFGLYVVASAVGAGRRLALPLASLVVVALACINLAGMAISLGRFYL